jgi:2'-5' RNA ligase
VSDGDAGSAGLWDHLADFRFGVFVIALPEPLGARVEALRRRFDPASARIAPPHISVTQPLAEEPNDIGRADLGALLAEFPPFEIRVGPARAFPGSTVVYLAVEPGEPVLAMRAAAHATGLFRTDLPYTEGFVPHVTIREWLGGASDAENGAVASETDRAVDVTTFRCDSLELWRPDGSGRFGPVEEVALVGP